MLTTNITNTPLAYTICYQASNYTGGYTLNIIIMNIGSVKIEDWTLDFDFPGDEVITSFWNISSFTQNGSSVSAASAEWNSIIKPNASITIGLSATSSRSFSTLLNVRLNDTRPIELLGNLEVTVSTPSFDPSLFTPSITVVGNTESIPFGSSYTFVDLTANQSYSITAAPFVDGNNLYSASITPNPVSVMPDETVSASVSYSSSPLNPNVFAGYFPSWSDRWASDGSMTDLANLPSYVNLVLVAFGVPDMNYTGNLDLTGTGLSFSYTGQVLKDALTTLKSRNPETKVVISIGGETYTNWEAFNPENIATFVRDFGFDGVDIDYEPAGGFNCSRNCPSCSITCTTDDFYVNLIETMRAQLPSPYLLTTTPFSVGAYGEGEFKDAPPANLTTTGMFLNVGARAGDMLDYILVQGYNAGVTFDPLQATQAYVSNFGDITKICMGAHVPPEAYGDHVWTVAEINRVGSYINDNNIGGMMMWELFRTNSNPSDNFPDNQIMASAIAEVLGFPNFDDPLFPLREDSSNEVNSR